MNRIGIFICALVLVFGFSLGAQGAQSTAAAPTVAATALRQKAMNLLEEMGTRKILEQNIEAMIENGREKLVQEHPGLDQAFVDEWSRRMHERVNIDDFLNVVVSIYEQHFSADELDALSRMYRDLAQNKTPQVPEALRQKLNDEIPDIQAEMGAGLMQLSEKIGGEVTQSIAADHPEYLRTTQQPAEAPKDQPQK